MSPELLMILLFTIAIPTYFSSLLCGKFYRIGFGSFYFPTFALSVLSYTTSFMCFYLFAAVMMQDAGLLPFLVAAILTICILYLSGKMLSPFATGFMRRLLSVLDDVQFRKHAERRTHA